MSDMKMHSCLPLKSNRELCKKVWCWCC